VRAYHYVIIFENMLKAQGGSDEGSHGEGKEEGKGSFFTDCGLFINIINSTLEKREEKEKVGQT